MKQLLLRNKERVQLLNSYFAFGNKGLNKPEIDFLGGATANSVQEAKLVLKRIDAVKRRQSIGSRKHTSVSFKRLDEGNQ